ncbi:MAG: PSD1 and planctomycete cytochrome C domain-containing protein [Aureliella sp.]
MSAFRVRFVVLPAALMLMFSVNGAIAEEQPTQGEERTIGFNRDIRPILSDKCFACHGPDAKTVEGDLRLDLREQAVGDSGAIVAGEPEASELVRRILSDDPDEVMPPPSLHKPLEASEIKMLRRWISQGAEYEAHWAYTIPERSAIAQKHPIDFIDRHIDMRLESEGVSAAEQADPVTLIRRLSLDLNGLPPTPEEVDAFLQDQSATSFDAVVDRLLQSPRYGERMAMYWLDLVRYADTVGYHGDQNVMQYPYRDYVIAAFNDNKPYDQFIKEQLAGDLLPDPSIDQLIASGYNRLNQTTEEGGSQAKEYLAIYFADRVRNASQVFMGATLGCAQCHDHKYDPFTAKDFYSFGAFFADLEERGVYSARSRPPTLKVYSEQLRQQIDALTAQLAGLQEQHDAATGSLLEQQADWEAEQLSLVDEVDQTRAVHSWIDDAADAKKLGAKGWDFVGKDIVAPHSGTQARRQTGDGIQQHTWINKKESLTVDLSTRISTWVYLDPENPPTAIMVQVNDGQWDHRIVFGSDEISYGRRDEDWDGYRRKGDLPATGQWHKIEIAPREVGLLPGDKIDGLAFTQYGGTAYWDTTQWSNDLGVSQELLDLLSTPAAQRTEEDEKAIEQCYLAGAPSLSKLDSQIDAINKQIEQLESQVPTTVVSRSVQPRTIRILPRGNWMDDSGEIVQPAFPEFLSESTGESQRLTRLDLANWLTERDNPLPARTMVNRIWALLFGRGICSSVDDFGGQGTYPSYPALLDDLAFEFVESGWDIKHIIKLIVSSEAYKRSSRVSEELQQLDPYNDLFARQGRYRVPAEVVRDTALFASGLLVEKIGGPSVRPYQPPGYYAQLNFPRREYKPDEGDQQFRRGLYTHWQRTFLHPMLKAFDAPSREECTAARARSSTPIQSLVLLNDPSFVEAARGLAIRVAESRELETQLAELYRLAVSRAPSERALAILTKVYESNLEQFETSAQAASDLLSVGISPLPDEWSEADSHSLAKLAALTMASRTVLNLHETIMRY